MCGCKTALTIAQNRTRTARYSAVVGLEAGGVGRRAHIKTVEIPCVVARQDLRRTIIGRRDG